MFYFRLYVFRQIKLFWEKEKEKKIKKEISQGIAIAAASPGR